MAKNNEFTYEVLATYAEKDNLKIRSVSFNNREPKFDIRHWSEKDGKEVMGKGVTLSIEELQYLSKELPKVLKALTKGAKVEEDEVEEEAESTEESEDEAEDNESNELDKRGQRLIEYILKNAPDNCKGVNVANGVTYATEGHIIVALRGESTAKTTKKNVKKMFDDQIANKLSAVKADVDAISKATFKRLKAGTTYSFGAKYNMVRADWLGKAVRVVGDGAKIYTNETNTIYVVKGAKGVVVLSPMKASGKKAGLVEAKAA